MFAFSGNIPVEYISHVLILSILWTSPEMYYVSTHTQLYYNQDELHTGVEEYISHVLILSTLWTSPECIMYLHPQLTPIPLIMLTR